MFCSKCGSKIEEGARFCVKCGIPVSKPIFEPAEYFWVDEKPEIDLNESSENLRLCFKYHNQAKHALDYKNYKTWDEALELYTKAINSCPFVLNNYQERSYDFSCISIETGKNWGHNAPLSYLKDFCERIYDITIQDMTVIIQKSNRKSLPALEEGIPDYPLGFPYYLRGLSYYSKKEREKEKARSDLEKALELGIGLHGIISGPTFKTEEEHAKMRLYQLDHGIVKGFFKILTS